MFSDRFAVGIEFPSILNAISKQIYDTPFAFIRENVQNAVDAIRMQAAREDDSLASDLAVHIVTESTKVEIRDNGIGMTLEDLKNLFWTIGASGKRTAEARAAGCVGMFGIGGFANFGICAELIVTSQSATDTIGHRTALSRDDIERAGGAIPEVSVAESIDVSPRGTCVSGLLLQPADASELEAYLRDCVRYVPEPIYCNGKLISQDLYEGFAEHTGDYTPVASPVEWSYASTTVQGAIFDGPGNTLYAELFGVQIGQQHNRLTGRVRFESGKIDVLKRGFRLCTTAVGTQIGVSGTIDCDRLSPTAGRDSLDPASSALLTEIVACLERAAVTTVLSSSARIAQHTRIFRYIRSQGLTSEIGNTVVDLADGRELTLSAIRHRSERGLRVFYSTSRNPQLAHVLQARGHIVVQLPYDSHKMRAVRDYLASYCQGEPFEGHVECLEHYNDLTRFEKHFLCEVEETVLDTFEVKLKELIPGRLSEDIPVYAPDPKGGALTLFVDVRHSEITKLETLGITSIFRSMVAAFCREYLGPVLKAHSPKFFGSGALNLDFLSKRRSELWVLLTRDIETVARGTQRQVVRSTDVQTVHAGSSSQEQSPLLEDRSRKPKLVHIVGSEEFSELSGYYLRIPASATAAYGDVIVQCENRAALWAGDKITLFASDDISTAFKFEVALDRLIVAGDADEAESIGATRLSVPVQALYEGLYFPIPDVLTSFLVPRDSEEIRIEVRCELSDYLTARSWEGAESTPE